MLLIFLGEGNGFSLKVFTIGGNFQEKGLDILQGNSFRQGESGIHALVKFYLEKHVMAGNGNVVHFIIFGHEGKLDIAGESDVGVFVIQVKGEAYAFG